MLLTREVVAAEAPAQPLVLAWLEVVMEAQKTLQVPGFFQSTTFLLINCAIFRSVLIKSLIFLPFMYAFLFMI